MTLRFSCGSRRPSAVAAFQPPAYQVQLTPFAESVSPMVLSFNGGTGCIALFAKSNALREAGANQPLVVEVGAAERRHEEVVGERVLPRPFPQLHLRAVEVAHHPRPGGRHGDEFVALAVVDLLAVLVVGVDRARQHLVGAAVYRRGIDAERAVRKRLRKARARLAVLE